MEILDPYKLFITELKTRIQTTQVRAALSVSRELITLYWQIGQDIVTAQKQYAWGDKVLERIAKDLQDALPGVEGFSKANLYRIRAFYLSYADESQFVAQLVRQIPWGHNIVLLQKLKDASQRLWYAQQTLEHGWSRSILELQIKSKLFERSGKAISNFAHTLPPLQSDLAQQILKDPYNLISRLICRLWRNSRRNWGN